MPLVTVGDTTLTLHHVLEKIPDGVTAADSATLFAGIVETWMQDALLRQVASENMVDMEKIDRMTREYRERLIVNEYMHRMQIGRTPAVEESKVKAYYQAHGAEMQLEHPLVQGIYIKVDADADHLSDLRRWMRSATPQSVDNIEKYGLTGALHYDYFKDRWVDWQQLAESIPYRFGNPDEFVSTHRDFETTVNGSTYILHISRYLNSGQVMPYDFASNIIRESLQQEDREAYGRQLLSELTERARAEGRLKTPGYDLTTHKMIINEQKNEKK